MRKIFKYDLATEGGVLSIPLGSKILSVAEQGNRIRLWAEVEVHDPDNFDVHVEYDCINTGDQPPHDDAMIFRGTVLLDRGSYVKHVYVSDPT